MKKTISIIVASVLLAAAVVVLVCTDGKYDNPLDKEGVNYLYGDTTDEKGKMATNGDGVAAFFYDTLNYKLCDASPPKVTLMGPSSVTINTEEGLNEFKKWMHLDNALWDSLITCTNEGAGVDKKARLTKGGITEVPVDEKNPKVPEVGEYMIVYRAWKIECNGREPADEKTRRLIVEKYEPKDTATARLILVGNPSPEVVEGGKYNDEGVQVMLGTQDITQAALDSVVVKRVGSNNVEQKLTKPVDFSKIAIPSNATAGYRYTITYYASRIVDGVSKPSNPASVVRNVTVIEQNTTGQPKAVIVLAPYKSTFNVGGVSKVIEHIDTVIASGGTYVEKGAKEAYFMKDGAKVPLDAGLVVKPNPPTIGSVENPTQRSVAYSLPGGTVAAGSYAEAEKVNRNIWVVVYMQGGCEVMASPEIRGVGGDTTLTAGVAWSNYDAWTVGNRDADGGQTWSTSGRKYILDLDGLDPKNPQKGTYNLTYVGVGACGSIATKARKVTVP